MTYEHYGNDNVDDLPDERASDADVDFDLSEEDDGGVNGGDDSTSEDSRVDDAICKEGSGPMLPIA